MLLPAADLYLPLLSKMAVSRLIWVPFSDGRDIALQLQPSPSLITPRGRSGPDRSQDWRDLHIPSAAMVLIVHPMDVGASFVVDMVYRLRQHDGPIAIFLESSFLNNDPDLTPITPLYASMGCTINPLDEANPMAPILAYRETIDGHPRH